MIVQSVASGRTIPSASALAADLPPECASTEGGGREAVRSGGDGSTHRHHRRRHRECGDLVKLALAVVIALDVVVHACCSG